MEPIKFFDDGWRLGLVVKIGRKYVIVLDCGTLKAAKMPVTEQRHFKPCAVPPHRLCRLLKRRRAALVKAATERRKAEAARNSDDGKPRRKRKRRTSYRVAADAITALKGV
jgi:hypothetical protein